MARTARVTIPFKDGVVLVGSDMHNWPAPDSTGYRAFLAWIEEFKPKVVVLNGDVIDAATISRHPPIGWEKHPTLKEELDVSQCRLARIKEAVSPGTRTIWNLGNHDARFETRLATLIPELKGVHGVHLRDHFPDWEPAWATELGGKHGIIIKHRFKGGSHAAHNNALASGRSVLTGHLHSLKVSPVTDYNGTRWGVDGGMLASPLGDQFTGYTEDNPLDWREGFVMLTWKDGRLLWPETVWVDDTQKDTVHWRGETYNV